MFKKTVLYKYSKLYSKLVDNQNSSNSSFSSDTSGYPKSTGMMSDIL